MPFRTHFTSFKNELKDAGVALIAVSKGQSIERIMEAYDAGQRDFGENRVQEMMEKYRALPKDIRWHMIGHLQRNKVKYIAAFVAMIQSVDSMKLLEVINDEGGKNNRVIDCLLQIKIAKEETKYGLGFEEAHEAFEFLCPPLDKGRYGRGQALSAKPRTSPNPSLARRGQNQIMLNIHIRGLMGMASLTDDLEQIRREFRALKKFFDEVRKKYYAMDSEFSILSMGMSGDWHTAVEEGSTMVRIGKAIFNTS